MSHHKLILWDPIKNEWQDNGGFCALSKEFVMTKWGVILTLHAITIIFMARNGSKAMWQDDICFDSKSVNHLPERYEGGYRFWGMRLTISEDLLKKYILRNSVAISSNRRNESMNHDQWMKYVYDTLKQTSSVPWCRHSNICHSYKILGHRTCHRCCYQR